MRSALILAAVAIVVAVVPLPAAAVEKWYSHGVYPMVQQALTPVSSLVPFALLDVAAAAGLVAGLAAITRRWRREGAARAVRGGALSAITVASLLYLTFIAVWGLNYRRVPLEAKLAYNHTRVTPEAMLGFAGIAGDRVNGLEAAMRTASPKSDERLEQAFAEAQRRLGARRLARSAAPKRSVVSWYFRRAGIDGMTNPFFLEIILNPDLLAVERPFAIAHEWAHLAGYASESEANFLAWLTCVGADDYAQYSGWLEAFRYAAAALAADDRRTLYRRLSPGVMEDLRAISRRLGRADPAVRNFAREVYDSYLKANRVDEGIANYDAVLRLMVGTTFENGWVPRLRRERTG